MQLQMDQRGNSACCIISFIENSRKCKLTDSNEKQTSGSLVMAGAGGVGGKKGDDWGRERKEDFWGYYLDVMVSQGSIWQT